MLVKEFVEKYNSFNNDALKEKYIKEIVKDVYVPYIAKCAICESIVNNTMKRTVSNGKNNKSIFYSDSTNRYLFFQMKLIEAYTDLKFSENNEAIKEFELLDEYGLNDIIIANIPEREYTNFKVILDMKTDDISINENNIINYIDTKLDAVGLALDVLSDSFSNIINDPEIQKAIKSVKSNEK